MFSIDCSMIGGLLEAKDRHVGFHMAPIPSDPTRSRPSSPPNKHGVQSKLLLRGKICFPEKPGELKALALSVQKIVHLGETVKRSEASSSAWRQLGWGCGSRYLGWGMGSM